MENLLKGSEAVVNDSSIRCPPQLKSGIDKDELKSMLIEMVPSLVSNVLNTVNNGKLVQGNGLIENDAVNIHESQSYRDMASRPSVQKTNQHNNKPPELFNKSVDFPLLIEENPTNPTQDIIEEAVLGTNIDIAGSFKSRKGDTVVLCKSSEDRKCLEAKFSEADIGSKVQDALPALSAFVTITGFTKEYSEDDIMKRIKSQDHFIKSFLELHGDDQMKFISISPTKKDQYVYKGMYRVTKCKSHYNIGVQRKQ